MSRLRYRPFWKLIPALFALSCGEIVLQTTSDTDSTSTPIYSDAGVVSDTFFVSGSTLRDPCGQPVILRGVNEMVSFDPDAKDGSPEFSEIAKTGANSVRIYWQPTESDVDLDRLLTNAEQTKLIPIVYVFNYTNGPETTASKAAAFWTQPNITAVVQNHRQWLIIALCEKALQTTESLNDWASSYDDAVAQLRRASITVPLAIDAPQYGLDTSDLATMGNDRIVADPKHNLLLNVNAWWSNVASVTVDTIRSNIKTVTNASLPLLIGEFAGYAQQKPACYDVTFDYATLLEVAQETHTGWTAWSWGRFPNIDCGHLNMTTDGTFPGLTDWGLDVATTNVNSIRNTSVAAKFTPGRGCQ